MPPLKFETEAELRAYVDYVMQQMGHAIFCADSSAETLRLAATYKQEVLAVLNRNEHLKPVQGLRIVAHNAIDSATVTADKAL